MNQTIEYYALTGISKQQLKYKTIFVKWKPLMLGFKLNTDGATNIESGKGGIGGFIRDTEGKWITGFMGNLPKYITTQEELFALLQGLIIAQHNKLTPLQIDIYCKKIIYYLQNDHHVFSNILSDCRVMLHQLGNPPPPPPQIQHRFREENQVEDALAEEESKLSTSICFVHYAVPPLFVSRKLKADKEELFLFG